MPAKPKKRVGLLGGAFNPIHYGHLDLIEHFKGSELVDEIWIVPSFSKEDQEIRIESRKRINMIRIALKDMNLDDFVKIKNFEVKTGKFVQTIDTINHFTTKYNHHFSFIFGSDYAESILLWKDARKFKDYVDLYCYPRINYDITSKGLKALLAVKAKTVSYQVKRGESSLIRKGKNLDITSGVKEYILENLLYIDDWAKNLIANEKTFQHCKRVATLMKNNSKKLGLNPSEAYLAGIFHDIGKNWPSSKSIKYLEKKTNMFKEYNEKVWHQFIAAYIVKDDLGIKRENVFKAILNHTSPFQNMKSLGKLLYVADKMDHKKFISTFNKQELFKMKQYIKNDIDKAFLIVLLKVYNHLLTKPEVTKKAINNLKKTYLYYKRLYTDGPNGRD